jgi:hypothetical protein
VATVSKPYTFAAGDTIESSKVNDDFDALYTAANNTLVHVDASKSFTGVPSGPATDPTSDNQFTRKRYVDGRTAGILDKHVVLNPLLGVTVAGLTDVGLLLSFTMPDLSVSGRAVRIDLSAYGVTFSGGDNTSTIELRMMRQSDNAQITGGWWTKGNGFLSGPRIEMTGWLFDNSMFAAGSTAKVVVHGTWTAGPAGKSAYVSGASNAPVTFVATQV